jgi:glutathione-independent formaldehyde dehydrogenase
MRGLVYRGTRRVAVEEVPDARIEAPTDVVVKITTTNICGSDLHMYDGRTGVEQGTVLGHENMGTVEEVGDAVTWFRKGDRVSVPFNIACGSCRSCNQGWTSFCERVNPIEGMQGSAYGYANMGPYPGGQAEYLRVPFADFNLLALPQGTDLENDFTMLSDIFPTAWHGTVLAGLKPGDACVVMGCGPVGLLAAHSALVQGARQAFAVDFHDDRLKLAESIGATPIDLRRGDPVEQILDATNGVGADCGVEAVGFQAHDPQGAENPALTLDNLVDSVKVHGGIGVVGVYVPEDPGVEDPQLAEGRVPFRFGQFFTKGQSMGTGQAPVKRYNAELRDLIIDGRATPGFLVSHELGLDQAPDAYESFDNREDGWTKVLLHPQEG